MECWLQRRQSWIVVHQSDSLSLFRKWRSGDVVVEHELHRRHRTVADEHHRDDEEKFTHSIPSGLLHRRTSPVLGLTTIHELSMEHRGSLSSATRWFRGDEKTARPTANLSCGLRCDCNQSSSLKSQRVLLFVRAISQTGDLSAAPSHLRSSSRNDLAAHFMDDWIKTVATLIPMNIQNPMTKFM